MNLATPIVRHLNRTLTETGLQDPNSDIWLLVRICVSPNSSPPFHSNSGQVFIVDAKTESVYGVRASWEQKAMETEDDGSIRIEYRLSLSQLSLIDPNGQIKIYEDPYNTLGPATFKLCNTVDEALEIAGDWAEDPLNYPKLSVRMIEDQFK